MHTIDELMEPTPMRLRLDSPLEEASRGMAQTGTDVLALCDPHGYFLGVVTKGALKHARRSMGELAYSLRAQHVMAIATPTVSLDQTVDEALCLMAAHTTEFLPVVQDGMLRGMLTSSVIAASDAPTTIAELTETSAASATTFDFSPAPSRAVSQVDLEAA